MKLISILLVIVFFAGCTTFRPVGLAQSDLKEQIASKIAIQPGDQVKIITNDGKRYKFKIVDVSDDYIEGEIVKVPVSDIVSIETKEFSRGKTTLLITGIVVIGVAIALGAAYADSLTSWQ